MNFKLIKKKNNNKNNNNNNNKILTRVKNILKNKKIQNKLDKMRWMH